jgi:hypothetical protein
MSYEGKIIYQENMAAATAALKNAFANTTILDLIQSARDVAKRTVERQAKNEWYAEMQRKSGIQPPVECETKQQCDKLKIDYDTVIAVLPNGVIINPKLAIAVSDKIAKSLLQVTCDFLFPILKEIILASGVTEDFFTQVFVVEFKKILVHLSKSPKSSWAATSSTYPNIYQEFTDTLIQNFGVIQGKATFKKESVQKILDETDEIKNDFRGTKFDDTAKKLHDKYDSTLDAASVSALIYQLAHCVFLFIGSNCHPDQNDIKYTSVLPEVIQRMPSPFTTLARYVYSASKTNIHETNLNNDQLHVLARISRCLIKYDVKSYIPLLNLLKLTTDRENALKALADNAKDDPSTKVDICSTQVITDDDLPVNLVDIMKGAGIYDEVCSATPAAQEIKTYLMGNVDGCGDDPTTP